METLDLNLLAALDALLTEGSVTGAARRLGLSSSAMSRTLARLRAATGDPLLVRAGRGLVPTPRATEIREDVHQLHHHVRKILSQPTGKLDFALLDRTFTIRASEGFVALFSVPLLTAIAEIAPHVCLRFVSKPAKDPTPLREAQIDLEIGVLGASAPEVRTQSLFRDKFVGAARQGHPLLTGTLTPERYAACDHVVTSRKEIFTGPVDEALEKIGLKRRIAAVVPSHLDAIRVARRSDLVALVPRSCVGSAMIAVEPQIGNLVSFELPVQTSEILISAMWHPRMHADPAHRWLRDMVKTACCEHFSHGSFIGK
ncbi:LysR family transcriptional regulator [Phyllobacterium phragmitis]|uniref:LysR family transcriptional regulator n=1 Tax=Phyllobacterium phragmitis TaxID=2670329 RepID=A0A2S9IRP2_9HYPH|nr:LysR family transcriptional regulator [Phyllobacterium phragmitis]PRD43203.1 LysR family transcriptional regulator [Phyllobacterium phragmitis]